MKQFQRQEFVELSCWRKEFIGLRSVSHPSEADFVTVKLEGLKDSVTIAMEGDGRAQFMWLMDALATAHKLGRRSIGLQIADIFEKPPVH